MNRLSRVISVCSAFVVAVFVGCANPSADGLGAVSEVSNLSARAMDASADVTWTDPSDSGFSGVEISCGGTTLPVVSKGVCRATVSGLVNGTTYTITAKTMASNGKKSAGVSVSVAPVATATSGTSTSGTTTSGGSSGTGGSGATTGGSGSATYGVLYDGNGATGGTVPSDSVRYASGATAKVLGAGTLVRDGYSFSCWNVAKDGSGIAYKPGDLLPIASSDVTLYAQWGLPHSLSFDLNGADSGTVPPAGSYAPGFTVTLPTNVGNLAKAGYVFTGWSPKSDGSAPVYQGGSSYLMGDSNSVLFSVWTLKSKALTVTYDRNGASDGSAPADTGAYLSGQTVTVFGNIGALTLAGKDFSGWSLKSDGSGIVYQSGDSFVLGDTSAVLYAVWKNAAPHTVTYDGNGATSGSVVDSKTYYAGDSVTVLSAGKLARSRYTFVGWNTKSDGSGSYCDPGTTIKMEMADVTLYALWIETSFVLTYDGNGATGGSVPVDTGVYSTNDTTTVARNTGKLIKSGYVFSGWNTKADGSGWSFAPGKTYIVGTASETLYAQWVKASEAYFDYTSSGGAVSITGLSSIWTSSTDSSKNALEIPSSIGGLPVTSIGNSAFEGKTTITSVSIPSGVTAIGTQAFYGCSALKSVSLPPTLDTIDYGAFWNCSALTSVSLPSSLRSLGELSFSGCSSLTSITIPSGVTLIPGRAFLGCSALASVTMPDTILEIGLQAFSGAAIQTISLPDSVTTLGLGVFFGCTTLKNIKLSSALHEVPLMTFVNCSSLVSVTSPATTPPAYTINPDYETIPSTATVYVPSSALSAYKAAMGWSALKLVGM